MSVRATTGDSPPDTSVRATARGLSPGHGRRRLGCTAVLVRLDDVESFHRAVGEMDAVWQRVGHAAGCVGVGVSRVRVAPGKLPTPPHSHGASEELYFVLSGSGLAWQDEAVHEIRA